MSKKKSSNPSQKQTSLRKHKYVFSLNDLENKALNRYLNKYKIRNKSKLIRESLMKEVISRMENDSPTLFDDVSF